MGKNIDLRLYLVTDRTGLDMESFLKRIEDSIKGGATIVQVREKMCSSREYIELAEKVHEITRKYNIPLIIDDRVDVALAVNAEGVHLGGEDMEIKRAREILGDNFIIGATAKSVEAAQKAEKDGADYIGCGAIYPTKTKVKTKITSPETFSEIKKSVKIPVAAIGGLNTDNLDILKGTNADGICVVRALMTSETAEDTARLLRERFEAL